MVEIVTIGVDPIVASQAVFAISLEVRLHKLSIDLLVAGGTDGLVKLCIAINMASFTSKRRTIGLSLVGVKGIAKSIVLKCQP